MNGKRCEEYVTRRISLIDNSIRDATTVVVRGVKETNRVGASTFKQLCILKLVMISKGSDGHQPCTSGAMSIVEY